MLVFVSGEKFVWLLWVCGWFCKRIVNCDLKTFIVQATGLVNLARANKNSQIKVI